MFGGPLDYVLLNILFLFKLFGSLLFIFLFGYSLLVPGCVRPADVTALYSIKNLKNYELLSYITGLSHLIIFDELSLHFLVLKIVIIIFSPPLHKNVISFVFFL